MTWPLHFRFRQNETAESIHHHVADGLLADIDTAVATAYIRNRDHEVIVAGGAVTIDGVATAADGSKSADFHYRLTTAATLVIGARYSVQFRIVYPGNTLQIVPQLTSLTYDVEEDYATLDAAPDQPSILGALQTQAAHGFAVLDVLFLAGATWTKAQADDPATLGEAIVCAVEDASRFRVLYLDNREALFPDHGLGAAGTRLYLSQSTAGFLTATAPLSGIKQQIAKVKDADSLILVSYPPEYL